MTTPAKSGLSVHSQRSHRALVPCALLGLMLAALAIDVPVARFCDDREYPRLVSDICNNAEPFGHAAGVVLIAGTLAVLDPERRRWAPGLCLAAAIGGGIGANILKLFVGRTRPRNLDFAAITGVSDTFVRWWPFGSGGSALQSFPSAHTATAAGLAVALAALYPTGRSWFTALAVLVAIHRVESSAHYPSDVMAGALVGWIVGRACLVLFAGRLSPAMPTTAPLRRAA